jgi:hypothetical protein
MLAVEDPAMRRKALDYNTGAGSTRAGKGAAFFSQTSNNPLLKPLNFKHYIIIDKR